MEQFQREVLWAPELTLVTSPCLQDTEPRGRLGLPQETLEKPSGGRAMVSGRLEYRGRPRGPEAGKRLVNAARARLRSGEPL